MKKKQNNREKNITFIIFMSMFLVLVLIDIFRSHKPIIEVKGTGNQVIVQNVTTSIVEPIIVSPKVVVKEVKLITNKPDIELQIRAIADEMGFKWTDYLVKLSNCESGLNPKAVSNQNRNGSRDYGLFQWNDKMPPLEITKDCAMDLDCSTRKTIEAINLGKQNHWMCDKIVLNK